MLRYMEELRDYESKKEEVGYLMDLFVSSSMMTSSFYWRFSKGSYLTV